MMRSIIAVVFFGIVDSLSVGFLSTRMASCDYIKKSDCCDDSACGFSSVKCRPLDELVVQYFRNKEAKKHTNACGKKTISGLVYKIRAVGIKQSNFTAGVSLTTCKKNTFVGDWGSTGARIYLAHESIGVQKNTGKHVKFDDQIAIAGWLHKTSNKGEISELVSTLKGQLAEGAKPLMAVMATAGNRLYREETDEVRSMLKEANGNTLFLQNCSNATGMAPGCRTLPGSVEAQYEFESVYHGDAAKVPYTLIATGSSCLNAQSQHPWYKGFSEPDTTADNCANKCVSWGIANNKECTGFDTRGGCMGYYDDSVTQGKNYNIGGDCYAIPKEDRVGIISAGGASLQMAFRVDASSMELARQCARSLREITSDTTYDDERVYLNETSRLLRLSWLSVRHENEPDKFAVGGLNEMRAAFERYFVMNITGRRESWPQLVRSAHARRNFPAHPCLQGDPAVNLERLSTDDFLATRTDRRLDTEADNFTGAGEKQVPYLKNGFDGDYITMLSGGKDATTRHCGDWLRDFIVQDNMVNAFQTNGCKSIAEQVTNWTLLSKFHWILGNEFVGDGTDGEGVMDKWKNLSGYDHSSKKYTSNTLDVPSQENGKNYEKHFNQAILMEVLVQLGVVDDTDTVKTGDLQWLGAAG